MTRLVLIAIAVAACGKGSGAGGAAGRDELIAAWKKGGLEPSAFTPATTPIGKDCASGTVNKVDVLICAFPSADEAKKAADAGLQWVGDVPAGSSQAKGSFVIAAADRHKADPSGRTINQLFKLAPN